MPDPVRDAGRPVRQEAQPAGTEVVEIVPGVLRFQLPADLPGLGHVNCYALPDAKGVTLVDPGLPGKTSAAALDDRLAQAGLAARAVHTVVVTHSHPDHYGGAGALTARAGSTMVTHEAFRTWWSHAHTEAGGDAGDTDEGGEAAMAPWERPSPWGGEPHRPGMVDRLRGQIELGQWVPPEPDRRVVDAETLEAGGRGWVVRHTPGHTPDHICLHDPDGGVLLSGDHVLPTITPHISGLGNEADPLESFLNSLDRVATLVGVGVVLPAHGQPFTDLAGRAADIRLHHEERLTRLEAASRALGWADVTSLSHELFRERSWGSMAESETYAHLEHLRLAGRAERREEAGLARYLAH